MVAAQPSLDTAHRGIGPGRVRSLDRGMQGQARDARPAPKRTLGQNRIFHALCGDIAKSGIEWAGCQRTAKEWKVLLISGHAKITGRQPDVVIGLEGEMVEIRESSARMSIPRSASLIEYTIAWATDRGIKLRDLL